MTNPTLARHFRELALLMELHGDNPFKIRSYRNAYNKLRKYDAELADLGEQDLQKLEGVGKAIAAKIHELTTTGRMATLEKWRERTPEGIREMLSVSGFGPKKVKAVWDGLGVTTVGQLLYAINENRLVELKGFGLKTQENLRQKLEFLQRSRGRFLYPTLERAALALVRQFEASHSAERTELTGALRRARPTLAHIELLTTLAPALCAQMEGLEVKKHDDDHTLAEVDELPVKIYHCKAQGFGLQQFIHTGSEAFVQTMRDKHALPEVSEEKDVFARTQVPYIPPERREDGNKMLLSGHGAAESLLTQDDIKGVVHTHSTYSDGLASVREMALAAREKGYSYLVMSDHSQAAFYAGGLKPDEVREQWREIDSLNEELAPFRILKGIECDILGDGSLDYDDELLAGFEVVIASVHSHLNMDRERATARVLAAVRHPRTHILGHPTGRLLLSREGYPLDHEAVIAACAENGVAIELNANPYRLDLDWRWIERATAAGVKISINPDAHSTGGIDDIRYGVLAARKGGLTAADCLNAGGWEDFLRDIRST